MDVNSRDGAPAIKSTRAVPTCCPAQEAANNMLCGHYLRVFFPVEQSNAPNGMNKS